MGLHAFKAALLLGQIAPRNFSCDLLHVFKSDRESRGGKKVFQSACPVIRGVARRGLFRAAALQPIIVSEARATTRLRSAKQHVRIVCFHTSELRHEWQGIQ